MSELEKEPKLSELERNMLYGFEVTDLGLSERIELLRASAGAIATRFLEAEVNHFEAEQGKSNLDFVNAVMSVFPQVHTEVDVKKSVDFLGFGVAVLKAVDFPFVCGEVASREKISVSDELSQDISSARSVPVWLPMSAKRDYTLKADHNRIRFKKDKVLAPFVIAGAKRTDSKNDTSRLLLVPILPKKYIDGRIHEVQPDKGLLNYYIRTIAPAEYSFLAFDLQFNQSIFMAEVSNKQLAQIESLQEVLLGHRVTAEELARMKNDDGTFSVSPSRIPVITAKNRSARTLQRRNSPRTIDDLEKEDFDISIADEKIDAITPTMMREYRVLDYLFRNALMFGKRKEFDKLKKRWQESHLKDPVETILEQEK